MKPAVVVFPDVLVDDSSQFPRCLVFFDLHAFRFERPEPALHDHVVDPASLAVHALKHVAVFQELLVSRRVIHRALVRVRYGRRAVRLDCVAHARHDARRAHVVEEPPPDDVAAKPVDYDDEVHVGPPDWDVGYVGGPDLVGEQDFLALQQVWVLPGALPGLGQVGLRVDGVHVHLVHQRLRRVPAVRKAHLLQLLRYLARARERHLQVDVVNRSHRRFAHLVDGGILRLRFVVVGRAGDSQQLALPLDRQHAICRVYQGGPCRRRRHSA